jgi:hypothetical protein
MYRKIKLTILFLFITTSGHAQEPRRATLQQQKMCAEQARKFFLDPQMERRPGLNTAAIMTPN